VLAVPFNTAILLIMKFDLDIMFGTIIGVLIILVSVLFKEKQTLQTQIDELRIIVNQKTLPALILDRNDFNIRY
jgi:hypothetical protein